MAPVGVLDAVAVVMVLPGLRQTVRPLVRIPDRVAARGVRHGLPHPGHGEQAKRHKESTSCHIGRAIICSHRRY